MLLIGKPSISMGHLYHGYVSHKQRVHHKMVILKGKLVIDHQYVQIYIYIYVVSDTHSFWWCHMPKIAKANGPESFLGIPTVTNWLGLCEHWMYTVCPPSDYWQAHVQLVNLFATYWMCLIFCGRVCPLVPCVVGMVSYQLKLWLASENTLAIKDGTGKRRCLHMLMNKIMWKTHINFH